MPDIDATILHVYQGLLEPHGFRGSLARIARALGGHLSVLHDEDLGAGTSGVSVAGIPEHELAEYISSYEQRWHDANPWMSASLPFLLDRGVQHGDAVVPRASLLQSDYYRNLLRPLEIEHSLGLRVGWTPGKRLSIVTVNRNRKAGAFGSDTVLLAERLRPHLELAFMLSQHLGGALAERVVLKHALDHAATGLMLLDADGRVEVMNAMAERTLDRLDVGHLSFSGRLEFRERKLRESWLRLLASDSASPRELRIQTTRSGESTALLRMHSLPPAPPILGRSGIRWIATIKEIDVPLRSDSEIRPRLCGAFGLTKREADVAMALRQHGSAPAAAAALGVAPSTVRFHLKNVFSKLNVQRQAQLLRIVERIAQG